MKHMVEINKGLRISDEHYTMDLNHESICKLQGMLILLHNKIVSEKDNPYPSARQDDLTFIRMIESKITLARRQGVPA